MKGPDRAKDQNGPNTTKMNGCSDGPARSGIIIDSSHNATHVIPVLNEQWQLPMTKRLGLGGFHHSDLLSKSLNLKYPQLKSQLTGDVV